MKKLIELIINKWKLTFSSPADSAKSGTTKQLLPLFVLLRIFGRCPFSFISDETTGQEYRLTYYRLKIGCKDRTFILSLVSSLFFLSVTTLGILQSGGLGFMLIPPGNLWPDIMALRREFDNQVGAMMHVILSSFEVGYTSQFLIEYLITWCTCSRLAKWLNNWNAIEQNLSIHCPFSTNGSNLAKFRNYLLVFYVGIPAATFGTMIASSDINISYPLAATIVLIYCYGSICCLLLEDLKAILMFRTIEIALKRVRENVQIRYQPHGEFKPIQRHVHQNPTKNEIREWLKIIIAIRKQADLAGKYLAIHQLLCIVLLMYFASSALFVCAILIGKFQDDGTVSFIVTFTMIAFTRLLFKITMAVRITEEEKRLARLCKDIELDEEESECQIEFSSIHEMLSNRPTEISLNNYLYLNNSLFLKISGQILTQFVVFMQFRDIM